MRAKKGTRFVLIGTGTEYERGTTKESSREGEPERNVRLLLAARRAHASPMQLFVSHIVHHRVFPGPVSPLSRVWAGVAAEHAHKQAEAVAARQTDPSSKAPQASEYVRVCFERGGPPVCHRQSPTSRHVPGVVGCAVVCNML